MNRKTDTAGYVWIQSAEEYSGRRMSSSVCAIPELVSLIFDFFDHPKFLAICARVNCLFQRLAEQTLWRGYDQLHGLASLWRTPSLDELQRVAHDPFKFRQRLSLIKHFDLWDRWPRSFFDDGSLWQPDIWTTARFLSLSVHVREYDIPNNAVYSCFIKTYEVLHLLANSIRIPY